MYYYVLRYGKKKKKKEISIILNEKLCFYRLNEHENSTFFKFCLFNL